MKFRTGYNMVCDLYHGFELKLGRLYVGFNFDWPNCVWYDKHWHTNEPGYLTAMAVARKKPKRWTLRGIRWPVFIAIGQRQWGHVFYVGGRIAYQKNWWEHPEERFVSRD